MSSSDKAIEEVTGIRGVDIEAALDPVEPDGVYRDSRECAALLIGGAKFLLSPPTPRPKKG